MHLKSIELSGFKSFAKRSALEFTSPIAGIVGPNGSGKSNTAEAFRFVLGEQSMKSMRGKRGPDLIWTGNDKTPRANRARVAVVFDNKNNLLDIDFDEVVIERIVHRDGANEYAINGSKVRLKDIAELLASANIGASGHHIISQGEADRILGASLKDRREIIEEALGLKTFQYKKVESEKKLAKTKENVKEAKMLRRELAPHLTFLERQMEKLKRSRELEEQLQEALIAYIHGERAYIAHEGERIRIAQALPKRHIAELDEEIARKEKVSAQNATVTDVLTHLDERARAIALEKSELQRTQGRLEGQIAFATQQPSDVQNTEEKMIARKEVDALLKGVQESIEEVVARKDVTVLGAVLETIKTFLARHAKAPDTPEVNDLREGDTVAGLEEELAEVVEALSALASEEARISLERENALTEISTAQQEARAQQQQLFDLKDKKRDAQRTLDSLVYNANELARIRERLDAVEHDVTFSVPEGMSAQAPTRAQQEDAYRAIERMQARLEEAGFVDQDTVKEYEETKERDAFLEREIADLEQSQKKLLEVLASIEGELRDRFGSGLGKINTEFKKFFSMLFDGGDAKLTLASLKTEDDEDAKEGIDIHVQLPRKKVSTLDVLSGGERALTSIALIFAMSQVNPPPFIILDETDAALDEANSRKYADMVRALSEHSQLILITHNRQTMEAAGELYGVTMGGDGVSKLLSVKFDDAVSVAK